MSDLFLLIYEAETFVQKLLCLCSSSGKTILRCSQLLRTISFDRHGAFMHQGLHAYRQSAGKI